jgi:DNA polymerase III epsilon subunit-like protein
MRILVFDTETTGLPQTQFISPDTLNKWPTIVQFSYIIFDTELNDIIESKDYIIKLPKSISISEESSKIHGITNEISLKQGVIITDVLNEFFYYLRGVDALVGHNVRFDLNMVKVELLRIIYNKSISREEVKQYKYDLHFITNYKNIHCTLKQSIELCNIKVLDKYGKEYLKYPKLIELHEKLFDALPNNLHNSFNDILVTLRCFIKLQYKDDLLEKCNSFKKYYNELNII